MNRPALVALLSLAWFQASAGQMDVSTFNNLRRGMPESEVLLRAGAPDLVTAPDGGVLAPGGGGYGVVTLSPVRRLHWIPDAGEHDPHLTIVTLTHGRVSALDRRKILAPDLPPPVPLAGAPAAPAPRSDVAIRRERAERTLEAAERYAEVRARIKAGAEAPGADAADRPVYRGRDASGHPYFGDLPPNGAAGEDGAR